MSVTLNPLPKKGDLLRLVIEGPVTWEHCGEVTIGGSISVDLEEDSKFITSIEINPRMYFSVGDIVEDKSSPGTKYLLVQGGYVYLTTHTFGRYDSSISSMHFHSDNYTLVGTVTA